MPINQTSDLAYKLATVNLNHCQLEAFPTKNMKQISRIVS